MLLLLCIFKLLSLIHKAVLKYRFALPKHAIGQRGNCTLYHRCSSAVRRYFQPSTANLLLPSHSSRYMHSTGRCTLCQGSHIFCSRSLVAVQHSTGRRTLCQGSLLHSHSSLHPGPQLTGTSASGILSLKDRLGQSWQEGLQTVLW